MWIWSIYTWPRPFCLYNNCNITFLTVFILTHPVNFPCGRKPEHPRFSPTERWLALSTWIRSENRTHLTHELRGDRTTDAPNNTTQYNTAQHSRVQHNTIQHSTTQQSTTQHNTTQQSTAQHNTAQHNTTQHSTAQHNTTQPSNHRRPEALYNEVTNL